MQANSTDVLEPRTATGSCRNSPTKGTVNFRLRFVAHRRLCLSSLFTHVATVLSTELRTDPLMPSSVLLAKSTNPPAGRASTPTIPLPSPLKNPAAPASFAPGE